MLKIRSIKSELDLPNWSPTWAETQGFIPPEPIAIIVKPRDKPSLVSSKANAMCPAQ